jgi:predicted dehydrogenase
VGRKDDDLGASRLKALIIGCGNIAGGYDLRGSKREVWTHAKAYQQNPGIDLIGVIDSSAQVARKFARTWDVPYSGTQLIPALKAVKPDVVSICSPTTTHVPLIETLCGAGIGAILCEKPLAHDLRAADRAVELCEKKGVLLAVNYQRNWDREMNRLGKAVAAGEFGRAEFVRVLYSKGLVHNGSHFVSLLDRWFGNLEVRKVLDCFDLSAQEVKADFIASSPAASRILFHSIPEHTYVLNELEVLFERGRLELRRGGLDAFWTDRHHDPLLPNDIALAAKSKRLPVTLPRAMVDVIQNFIAAFRGTEQLESNPQAALRTLRFCARVRTLARQRHA